MYNDNKISNKVAEYIISPDKAEERFGRHPMSAIGRFFIIKYMQEVSICT